MFFGIVVFLWERPMKAKYAAACLLMFVSLSAWQLAAQQATIQGPSRNKSITVERQAARPMQRRLPGIALPPKPVCEGANYATDDYNDSWLMGGPIVAIAWTPAASVTVSRIEVFTGEGSGNIALAIWSDDGGGPSKPLANLGDTGYFPLPTTTVSWQGANLLTPVTVAAGTKYWVLFDPVGGEQAPIQNGVGQQYWGSSSGTITSVPPADWFGPFSSSDHAWKFRMFCLPAKDVYAVKFLCGSLLPNATTPPQDGVEWPVKPGNYLTAINVHNPNPASVAFKKKAVLLYRFGQHFEPEQPMPPGKLVDAALKDDWGLEIDCADIRSKLLGGAVPPPTFIKGWVIIEVTGAQYNLEPRPLDVTAVYTSHGWNLRVSPPTYEGFAEDVEAVLPKRIKP
jgi:hypothetical protein